MSLIEFGYKRIVRPRIFAFSRHNAELAHDWGIMQLRRLEESRLLASLSSLLLTYENPILEASLGKLRFKNPLGLAAGFDKYGRAHRRAIPACGFGFLEIGGFTRDRQEGNSGIRIQRSEELKALWNYLGLPNQGALNAAFELSDIFAPRSLVPVGLNVAKSKTTPLEEAVEDYRYTISLLWPYVDFIVIAVSSPNTPGMRSLQKKDALRALIQGCRRQNWRPYGPSGAKPMGIKISPDLSDEELADIVEVCIEEKFVDFVVATNTTTKRDKVSGWNIPADRGGVSGPPLYADSNRMVRELHQALRGTPIKIIGVGGISNPRQLYDMILSGASVCEVYTAWPFEGPDMCKRWLKQLVRYLKSDGFENVGKAVGKLHY